MFIRNFYFTAIAVSKKHYLLSPVSIIMSEICDKVEELFVVNITVVKNKYGRSLLFVRLQNPSPNTTSTLQMLAG